MSLSINPDLGDSIVIDDVGVRVDITYQYKDTEFGDPPGTKGEFTAQFPRDFQELSVGDDSELEEALMTLAKMVARRTGVHS